MYTLRGVRVNFQVPRKTHTKPSANQDKNNTVQKEFSSVNKT